MPQFGAQIDTLRIPIKGLIPEQSATALTSPVEGLVWHDTVNKHLFVWLNGAWVQIDNTTSGLPTNVTDGDKGVITVTGGVWALDASTVTSANIVDGAIQDADVSPTAAIQQSKIAGLTTALAGKADSARVLTAGAGLTGGGDLTADRSFNVIAGDTSILVNPDDLRVQINSVGGMPSLQTGAGGMSVKHDTSLADSSTGLGINRAVSDTWYVDVAGDTMTGFLTLNADPTNPMHAATKAYVDSVAQGLDPKLSVKAASTGTVNLNAPVTILDGVSLVNGDRYLLKNQSNFAENGIYWGTTASAGIPVRVPDMDAWTEVPSAFTWVEQGTTLADTGWVCTSDQGGTLGTTAIVWAQFTGASQILAGTGMTKTANTLDVIAGPGLETSADEIHVAPNGITNSMIADGAVNLGTADVTGTLPIAKGGTGATTAPAARAALGVPTILTAVIPALPTPGAYVTVPGIVRPGGGPISPLTVGFGFVPAGDTAASGEVFLDWKTRGVAEDFQVKADVAVPASTYNVTVVMAG